MKYLCSWSLFTALFLSDFALAQFPSWDTEQSAVWELVEQSWVDEVAESDRWPREYVHQKVVAWGDSQPAPRGIDKLVEWFRFDFAATNVLFYEITPAAIVVEDDTAVVHYHLMTVTEDHKGDRETSRVSLIEVLIRQNGDWKFLSLSDFEPKTNDD
jgi:hypothetical protein